MIKRGYMVTSRGLRRPLSVTLWLFRSIKSSNEDQNNFPHIPKSLKTQLQSNINDIKVWYYDQKEPMGRPPGVSRDPFLWFQGYADPLNHQNDATISFPIHSNHFKHNFPYPQILIYSFKGNTNDIRCDMMTKRGCGATSRGLRRPPSVALGSCRPLESSNGCQNKSFHAPKPLFTHFKVI